MVPMVLLGEGTSGVSTVLADITTYLTSYVTDVTSWMTSLVPAAMPIVGVAVSVFFAIRIVKRLAKG